MPINKIAVKKQLFWWEFGRCEMCGQTPCPRLLPATGCFIDFDRWNKWARSQGREPMKRPEVASGPSASPGVFSDAKMQKDYPLIVEFLTSVKYDDGTARELSAISIFSDDGNVKLALNDKDLKRSAYVTAGSLVEALRALERGLENNTHDWRSWNAGYKKKK